MKVKFLCVFRDGSHIFTRTIAENNTENENVKMKEEAKTRKPWTWNNLRRKRTAKSNRATICLGKEEGKQELKVKLSYPFLKQTPKPKEQTWTITYFNKSYCPRKFNYLRLCSWWYHEMSYYFWNSKRRRLSGLLQYIFISLFCRDTSSQRRRRLLMRTSPDFDFFRLKD